MPVVKKDGEFFIGKEIYTLSHQRYYTQKKQFVTTKLTIKCKSSLKIKGTSSQRCNGLIHANYKYNI